jgi:putative nucleotidyltransferase with HDIG domain
MTLNLENLKDWFFRYVNTFESIDNDVQENIVLKKNHTLRVCKEIVHIGVELGLSNEELKLAEIIALFHDIGRFEQYARYKTFVDRFSENHAELGVKILREKRVFDEFEENIKSLMLRTILYHNRATLPVDETEECLFFLKLLRDADKLDIFKVVTDYYCQKDKKKNKAIELGLPDTSHYSEKVLNDLIEKKWINTSDIKNLNDFKLLQISWIYDINYTPTFKCIQARKYLDKIYNTLPKYEKIDKCISVIQSYLDYKTIP